VVRTFQAPDDSSGIELIAAPPNRREFDQSPQGALPGGFLYSRRLRADIRQAPAMSIYETELPLLRISENPLDARFAHELSKLAWAVRKLGHMQV
jgi:hypothetical protein